MSCAIKEVNLRRLPNSKFFSLQPGSAWSTHEGQSCQHPGSMSEPQMLSEQERKLSSACVRVPIGGEGVVQNFTLQALPSPKATQPADVTDAVDTAVASADTALEAERAQVRAWHALHSTFLGLLEGKEPLCRWTTGLPVRAMRLRSTYCWA